MRSNLNLYTKRIKEEFRGYDDRRVKEELNKYQQYVIRIIEYYRNTPATFDYKVLEPPTKSKKDYSVRIQISDANAAELKQLVDGDYIKKVYEYDDPDQKERGKEIGIKSRDSRKNVLELDRRPASKQLQFLRIDGTLRRQQQAIKTLMYSPSLDHVALLKLFHDRSEISLDPAWEQHVDKWFVLTEERCGAEQQKQFVQKALGTPDFAFLEGPPGSGKTTTLCELVHQIAHSGKRVLFCASTHVAVDNLLEKITDKYTKKPTDSNIIPLRIGTSEKISGVTSGYKYEEFIGTIREKISNHLSSAKPKSRAQQALLSVISEGDTIQRMARDCANLVCGTTTGILQYPDLQDNQMFDYMILDEASKTTFQEFLVPAVRAKRWIIVGDTKQLVPHTDQKYIELHANACLDERRAEVYHDVFFAERGVVLVAASEIVKESYRDRCKETSVKIQDAGGPVKGAGLFIGSSSSLAKMDAPTLKSIATKKNVVIRGYDAILDQLGRDSGKNEECRRLWAEIWQKSAAADDRTWGAEIAWRLITLESDIALAGMGEGDDELQAGSKILKDIDSLMPRDDSRKEIEERLDDVKKVALPSILHLLQHGYGPRSDDGIMTKGMQEDDFEARHVLLQWQHRMHPEIAEFARNNVYMGKALNTHDAIRAARGWDYDAYSTRLAWLDVTGSFAGSSNEEEARRIIKEIRGFYDWACDNPKPGKEPWEIAVLSFYTGQVNLLREHLQDLTSSKELHTFVMKNARALTIELRTVDSFQGHEADVVFLSMANQHPTYFLENSNRINVAITRARYQNVVVGNRHAMEGSKSLIGKLALAVKVHD